MKNQAYAEQQPDMSKMKYAYRPVFEEGLQDEVVDAIVGYQNHPDYAHYTDELYDFLELSAIGRPSADDIEEDFQLFLAAAAKATRVRAFVRDWADHFSHANQNAFDLWLGRLMQGAALNIKVISFYPGFVSLELIEYTALVPFLEFIKLHQLYVVESVQPLENMTWKITLRPDTRHTDHIKVETE